MEKNSTFSERLKLYRQSHSYTLADIEKITGIPAQTIHRYERNERTPKIDTVAEIAEALMVDVLWLIGYDTNENEFSIMIDKISSELNEEGKKKIVEYAKDIISSGKYKKTEV